MTASPLPNHFGPYEIEHALGRGAIGTVYSARDTRIGRRVALKTIQLPDRSFEDATAAREFFQRLQREAEVSGSLLHPNIVTLYEAGYENDRISFLAMELVEGDTLLGLMKRSRPEGLPVEVALRVTADVLRGLAHAHAKGFVHRDIKPANILVATDGTAKIADFGIARPQVSSMTAAGALVGTPNYMSPEQVTGAELTPRADLFSLGVVLYEMLTAVKPFAADDVTGILHNILRHEPAAVSTLNLKVAPAVSDFIARLLQKTPENRPSADEALATVEGLLSRDPLPSPGASRHPLPQAGEGTPPRTPSALRRHVQPALAAALIGGAILLVAIPALVLRSRTDDSPTVSIPEQQLAEFDEKRSALLAADALLNEGSYEKSLLAYEDYLQKYPHSTAAEEGRMRAAAAIEEAERAANPAQRAGARQRPSKKDEDISPRELLERIKRVFKR